MNYANNEEPRQVTTNISIFSLIIFSSFLFALYVALWLIKRFAKWVLLYFAVGRPAWNASSSIYRRCSLWVRSAYDAVRRSPRWASNYRNTELPITNQTLRVALSLWQLVYEVNLSIYIRLTRLFLDLNLDKVAAEAVASAVSSQLEWRNGQHETAAQAGVEVGLPAVLIAILGLIITGKQTKGVTITSLGKAASGAMQSLGKLGNATVGIEKLFTNSSKYIEYIMDYFFGLQSKEYKAYHQLETHARGILEWSSQVTALSLRENVHQDIARDPGVRMQVIQLKKLALNYAELLGRNVYARPYMEAFTRSLNIIKDLGNTAELSLRNTNRHIEPFVISFFGHPGIGKSYLINDITLRTLTDLNIPGFDRKNTYYMRNGEDFWSGYAQQFAVVFDDFSQFIDSADNIALKEFFQIVTPVQASIPMASLDDKGSKMVSPLIITTDNVGYPRMQTIRSQVAYRRRRTLHVEVKHVSGRKFSQSDLSTYALDHLRFQRMDPENETAIGEPMLYGDFYTKVYLPMFSEHYERMKVTEFTLLPLRISPEVGPSNETPSSSGSSVSEEVTLSTEAQAGDEEEHEQQLEPRETYQQTRAERILYYWLRGEFNISTDLINATHIELREAVIGLNDLIILDRFDHAVLLLGIEPEWYSELSDFKTFVRSKITSMREKIVAPGNRKAFLLLTGVLGASSLLYFAYTLLKKGRMEAQSSNESGDYRTSYTTKVHVVPKGKVSNRPYIRNNAKAQAGQHAEDVVTKIMPSMTRIRNSKISVNALQLFGQIFLLPFHFIELTEDDEVCVLQYNTGEVFYMRFDQIKSHRVGTQDLAIVHLGAHVKPGPNILKHIVTAGQQGKRTNDVDTNLLRVTEDFTAHRYVLSAKLISLVGQHISYPSLVPAQPEYRLAHFWEYSCGRTDKFCGALLVNMEHNFQKRIIGMHVAGACSQNISWAEPICRETIDEAINANKWSQVDVVAEETFSSGKYKVLPEGDVKSRPILPPTGFAVVGFAPANQSVQLPTKTDIKPSRIHRLAYEPVTAPSVLSPRDPRLKVKKSTLFSNGFDKYSRKVIPFPKEVHDHVVESLSQEIMRMEPAVEERRVRSVDEAINGVFSNRETLERIKYMDHINFDSSPGFPYMHERKPGEKGKRFLFREKEDQTLEMSNPQLIARLRQRTSNAKHGKRIFSPWIDQLKDERRAHAKIENGETRTFCMAPTDYIILFRQYFMDFCGAFYKNHTDTFHAVGINVDGPEWTKMYMHLVQNGEYGFAGDYKQFDGIAHNDAQMALCDIINEWYGDPWDSENARVRRVLISEGIYTLSLVGNCYYYVPQGVNSGNPATVILDSFVNQYYLRCAYRLLLQEHGRDDLSSMDSYRKLVRSVSYGDDNINLVSEQLDNYYNLITVSGKLAEYGVTYTSADKTKSLDECEPIIHISEMTFLKRSFSAHPNYPSFFRAPIDKKTIQELTNWIRDGQDEVESTMTNLTTSLHYAYHWGPQYYEEHKNRINQALTSLKLLPLTLPYKDLDKEWLSLHWNG